MQEPSGRAGAQIEALTNALKGTAKVSFSHEWKVDPSKPLLMQGEAELINEPPDDAPPWQPRIAVASSATEKQDDANGSTAPEPPSRRKPPLPRTLELHAIELQKLHSLDPHGQRFCATLWTEWRFVGGVNDPDLSAKGIVFPRDANGKPTFRPSAEWYADHTDFRNALNYKTIDCKRTDRGDDIVITMRHEGVFTEIFELEHFPCDQQALTITFNINCRCTGPVPTELTISPDCKLTMECIHLCPPRKEWYLERELVLTPHRIGSGDREFPAMSFTAMVTRKPFYTIVQMALPMGLFSLLSVLQPLCVQDAVEYSHRAQLSLMLLLTYTSFKMAIANKLPEINYMTLLDQYALWNGLLIILVALWSRMLTWNGSLEAGYPLDFLDPWFGWLFLSIWLYVHALNLYRLEHHMRSPEILDAHLRASHPGRITIHDSITADDHDTARAIERLGAWHEENESSSAAAMKRAASRALRRDSTRPAAMGRTASKTLRRDHDEVRPQAMW